MRIRRERPDLLDPEQRRAFERFTGRVAAAQRALLAAVPTPRDPGIPLDEALRAFADGLTEAGQDLEAWRADTVAHRWDACSEAIDAARQEAVAALHPGADPGFEALNELLGNILHPLEVIADAESDLRRR